MAVNHQQIYKQNAFGGITNTTVCGRVDNSLEDANKDAGEVTCKHCLRIIKEGRHYNVRWIGWAPGEETPK